MKNTANMKTVLAYEARLADVEKQIVRIQNALVTDVADGMWRGEVLTWGEVGDLAHVADELKSVANFITGEAE